jgi:hypothetical protein
MTDGHRLSPLDIEAMYPADPDLMASPEGDKRGLRQLQDAARARLAQLGREPRSGQH